MLEVTKKTTVKTRKKHECYGCCEIVEKGAAAVHVRGKEDGRYVSFHLHIQCHITAMKNKLFANGFVKGAVKKIQQQIEDYTIDKNKCPF